MALEINKVQPELTIFMDGQCPLCVKEMQQLRRWDKGGRILMVDINNKDEQLSHPDINPLEALTILHGKLADGSMLLGLDVTHKAWSIVGKGRWIAPLRWPVLKWLADCGYRIFARHRFALSRLLTGQSRLSDCDQCRVSSLTRNQK